jgi:hypothetical protein
LQRDVALKLPFQGSAQGRVRRALQARARHSRDADASQHREAL